MAPAIAARDLAKDFGSVRAVDGLDLNIRSGEIYGFLGPNGSGKTTTIMMLLGVLEPSRGTIELFGEPYTARRLDLRGRVGVVPEKHPRGVWRWMTATEYLGLFCSLFAVPRPRQRMAQLLERVGLQHVAQRRVAGFSRGMLQKLSIVRALLHDPDLLFLDEPISGLDPIGIKQVRDLILAERREGRTIFVSSHLLSEVERICDRVAIMYRGRLVAEDALAALLGRAAPRKQLEIELESLPDGTLAALRDLDFVAGCEADGAVLRLEVPADRDVRRDVSSWLFGHGLVPLRIQEVGRTLEELFFEITTENVRSLAAGRRPDPGVTVSGEARS